MAMGHAAARTAWLHVPGRLGERAHKPLVNASPGGQRERGSLLEAMQ